MIKTTRSPEETKALAAEVATQILAKGPALRGATIVALYGELGAGKTTFTQGFFKGLGIKRVPSSPTFILMRRTALQRSVVAKSGFKNIFHIDAYRLRPGGTDDLGFKALIAEPANILLVEWPERLGGLLPRSVRRIPQAKTGPVVHRIRFSHSRKENERSITLPAL